MLEHEDLTERIIGAAIEVHRALGPGYIESMYEAALAIELNRAGLCFVQQYEVEVRYREQVVGRHRLDLLVEDEIVVELKAVRAIEPVHFTIVRSYLKAVGRKHALLPNFASAPLDIRRVMSP